MVAGVIISLNDEQIDATMMTKAGLLLQRPGLACLLDFDLWVVVLSSSSVSRHRRRRFFSPVVRRVRVSLFRQQKMIC